MSASILYWKWDDSHLESGKYREQVEDIVSRSVFSHIYITTHWCHQGIITSKMHECIADASRLLHQNGRKFIFEIDARAEKHDFCSRNPEHKMGFIAHQTLVIPENGRMDVVFPLAQSGGGELFLGNQRSGEELVCAYAFEVGQSPQEVNALLTRISESEVCVKVDAPQFAGKKLFIAIVAYLEFPDFLSEEFARYFQHLFDLYADIEIDGVALDEMGYPWHPDFNFNPSTYAVWNNAPIYAKDYAKIYQSAYGTSYALDIFHMFCGESTDKNRIRAINRYYAFLRKSVVLQEEFFYTQAKRIFGKDCLVGVHPTWYAIEEVDNSPEIWKNGIDWWEVPRDYGFTDEIMIYPVRFSLTHKCCSHLFYNMWYGEATNQIQTYYEELWRNVRYGGRTISLGYECANEQGIVRELKNGHDLEIISEIERRIKLLDEYQTSAVASDILIVFGIEAACNILKNTNGNGAYNTYQSVFKNAFVLARDIFLMGYNCDLVASYEIANGKIGFDENGFARYGNQSYRYVVMLELEYSPKSVIEFVEKVKNSRSGLTVIGEVTRDFNGEPATLQYDYLGRIEAIDFIQYFERFGAQKNRLSCGAVLQDESVILTAPYPNLPYGNVFETTFAHKGKQYHVQAEDFVYVRFLSDDIIQKISPNLILFENI